MSGSVLHFKRLMIIFVPLGTKMVSIGLPSVEVMGFSNGRMISLFALGHR